MKTRSISLKLFLLVQLLMIAGLGIAYATLPKQGKSEVQEMITGHKQYPKVVLEKKTAWRVPPLFDDPEVVSDEELAMVLSKVRPKFPHNKNKPNFVEHALRFWHVDAVFQDPDVMSGEEMKNFLTDHGRYLASWGGDIKPLFIDREEGVAIRWGYEEGASVHHDHWLASLTEGGIALDETLVTPSRRMTVQEAVQEGLRDFHLDERETEWSAMAFGLWLAPDGQKDWTTNDGRVITFDMLAERLIRGHCRYGVCGGTHRVYSLMLLWRLNEEFGILSDDMKEKVWSHLEYVRDTITQSQFEDGHWPWNWADGKKAVEEPEYRDEYQSVIATGHHLEWLAIAPEELHPPREQILKAADWLIKNVESKSPEQIMQHYTFYSHVGSAFSLWRKTRAADFWRKWQQTHPWEPNQPVQVRTPLVAPLPEEPAL